MSTFQPGVHAWLAVDEQHVQRVPELQMTDASNTWKSMSLTQKVALKVGSLDAATVMPNTPDDQRVLPPVVHAAVPGMPPKPPSGRLPLPYMGGLTKVEVLSRRVDWLEDLGRNTRRVIQAQDLQIVTLKQMCEAHDAQISTWKKMIEVASHRPRVRHLAHMYTCKTGCHSCGSSVCSF